MAMCDDVRGMTRVPVQALASVGVDTAALQQIVAMLGQALTQSVSEMDLVALFEGGS